jgi:3-methylcrotonyl-CoA carboxylase beta subunit
MHVRLQVERDKRSAKGEEWAADAEAAFRESIAHKYDAEALPLFSTARLWDDGVINPVDTRRVLGLALEAALHGRTHAPRADAAAKANYGVFRM